jgi:RNA ligase
MLNIEDFRKAADEGWLKRVVSGPFELFNYSQQCAVEQEWTEVTMEARGVVFQDGQIVCRPMRKFFNSHEPFGASLLESVSPSMALVKLDGTLINVWFDLQGQMHVSTRGSLDNEYIDGAWDLIRQRGIEVMLELHRDTTWSFEYTYPQERFTMPSVIPHDTERLTLLNMRMKDGSEMDSAIIPEFNSAIYPDVDYFYNLFVSIDSDDLVGRMEELAKTLPYTDEGWVLSVHDGTLNHRVKIKGAQYVAMHRVIHGMTPRAVADAWYAGMCDQLVTMLYEPHASLLRAKFDVYDGEASKAVEMVTAWIAGFKVVNEEFSRKDFVLQAQEEIPEVWQLAIKAEFGKDFESYVNEWVVKKSVGKPPRTWNLPVTDDVKVEAN